MYNANRIAIAPLAVLDYCSRFVAPARYGDASATVISMVRMNVELSTMLILKNSKRFCNVYGLISAALVRLLISYYSYTTALHHTCTALRLYSY